MKRAASAMIGIMMSIAGGSARAGPPYATDDPEPVEQRRWELYLAMQQYRDRAGWSGTAPHFEVNYGLVPDVQLHLIAPLAYSAPKDDVAHYGYGDTELGVKLRFVREGRWMPQVGIFPFLEIPTGNRDRGLGNGGAQVFLPVWFQKSFGPWTTYGGGGPWFDLGERHAQWWYIGWQAQRRIVEGLTMGAEIFHLSPKGADGESDTRFNVGAVIDFGGTHHLLLSAGRSIVGSNRFQGYFAYLVTLGPAETAKAP